jgi:hypothetical protein
MTVRSFVLVTRSHLDLHLGRLTGPAIVEGARNAPVTHDLATAYADEKGRYLCAPALAAVPIPEVIQEVTCAMPVGGWSTGLAKTTT